MTTLASVPQWFDSSLLWPFDFLLTKAITERVRVIEKILRTETGTMGGLGSPVMTNWYHNSYHITMATQHGRLQIEVSKEFYDLLQVSDPIIVTYRQGNFSKTLKGKIAR